MTDPQVFNFSKHGLDTVRFTNSLSCIYFSISSKHYIESNASRGLRPFMLLPLRHTREQSTTTCTSNTLHDAHQSLGCCRPLPLQCQGCVTYLKQKKTRFKYIRSSHNFFAAYHEKYSNNIFSFLHLGLVRTRMSTILITQLPAP